MFVSITFSFLMNKTGNVSFLLKTFFSTDFFLEMRSLFWTPLHREVAEKRQRLPNLQRQSDQKRHQVLIYRFKLFPRVKSQAISRLYQQYRALQNTILCLHVKTSESLNY